MKQNYYQFLKKAHEKLQPSGYLEIGVRKLESFGLAKDETLCIGIDPNPQFTRDLRKNEKIFSETSDDFFLKHKLTKELESRSLDLVFIDGMHLFEYALRDFINVEKYSHPGTVVIIHDCLPLDNITSSRQRTTNFWTGDIWKMVFCLQKYRPDLKISLVDASPSGIAVITGLESSNIVLEEKLSVITSEYVKMKYSFYEENRFQIELLIRSAEEIIENTGSLSQRASCSARMKVSGNPKALAVMLCYNDGDILEDLITHFLNNNHHIVAWDHGSDDHTPEVLEKFKGDLIERTNIPRDFDFHNLYQEMSRHLINNYIDKYDWISWPDQDEILEGPQRDKSYYEYITEVFHSQYNWIQFQNFNFWFTDVDDQKIKAPVARIRHYSIFIDCAPRIRSWRAKLTNIRLYNHNPVGGERFPAFFCLKHYPARGEEQILKRINKDRANIQQGNSNFHYDNMKNHTRNIHINPEELFVDDGKSELSRLAKYDWNRVYNPEKLNNEKIAKYNAFLFIQEILKLIKNGKVNWACSYYYSNRKLIFSFPEMKRIDFIMKDLAEKQGIMLEGGNEVSG